MQDLVRVPYIVYDVRPSVDAIRQAYLAGNLNLDRQMGLDQFIDVWLDYQMMDTHWVSLENLDGVMGLNSIVSGQLNSPHLEYAFYCFHQVLFVPPQLTGSNIVTKRIGGGYWVYFK